MTPPPLSTVERWLWCYLIAATVILIVGNILHWGKPS